MSYLNLKNLAPQLSKGTALIGLLCVTGHVANATTYTTSVFASGAAVGSTAPDSVTYGGGSVWINTAMAQTQATTPEPAPSFATAQPAQSSILTRSPAPSMA